MRRGCSRPHGLRQRRAGAEEGVVALAKVDGDAAVEGIDDAFISVHMCHAHFNRRHSTSGAYDLIIDALGEMNVDRFAMEFATPDAGGIGALRDFPEDKVLGLGVIDHTDPHIETPEEVADRVERAMEFVPKERITLNPDCGFGTFAERNVNIARIAAKKLAAVSQAASKLRSEFG